MDWPLRGDKIRCPLHEEKSGSFHVYEKNQTWYCFGCGRGGDVIALVGAVLGMAFKDALYLVAGWVGVGESPAPTFAAPTPRPSPEKQYQLIRAVAHKNVVEAQRERWPDATADDRTWLYSYWDEISRRVKAGDIGYEEAIDDTLIWRLWALGEINDSGTKHRSQTERTNRVQQENGPSVHTLGHQEV